MPDRSNEEVVPVAPTAEQLAKWAKTLGDVLAEAEEAVGDFNPHCYPPEFLMALRLAWRTTCERADVVQSVEAFDAA